MESTNEERHASRYLFIAFGVMALPIVLLLTLGRHQLKISYLRLGLACTCFVIAIWFLQFLTDKTKHWWSEGSVNHIVFWTLAYLFVFCFLGWIFFSDVSILGAFGWSFYMAAIGRWPRNSQNRDPQSS